MTKSPFSSLCLAILLTGCSGADGPLFADDGGGGDQATPNPPGTSGFDASGQDGSVDPVDATLPDAIAPNDAGARDAAAKDAGIDSSPGDSGARDASPDAPADAGVDARPDAGPAASCTVTVAPTSGSTSDTFTGTLVSAFATTCGAIVDGNAPISIPCNGSTSWPGTSYGGAGVHSVIVSVAGPGGASQCTTSWTVTDPTVPTCTVSVTPSRGKVSDTYVGQLTSNGASACTYRVDNGSATSVPCAGSIQFQGSVYGAGTHVVVVSASGDGASTCTATWVEEP